mmetsp:Transcript_44334/g.37194  ORF Transcript_44334/g.37194 Transcript_44334/m.37194 type:complete len:213 (-) Transcript_44334:178-816(-)
MSSPRAATSVATMTRTWPFVNCVRACVRSHWSLSPWMDTAFHLNLARPLTMRSHMYFLLANTMMRASSGFSNVFMILMSSSSLSIESTLCTTCVTSLLAVSSFAEPPMLICTGFFKYEAARRSTALGHVAVNMSDWNWFSLGIWSRISRICGSNPMSSMRSASSNTTYLRRFSGITGGFFIFRKSIMRPGVPMSTWMPIMSVRIWGPLGMPP